MSEIASPRTALILYGSETGNAHDLAEELGRATQRLHFSSEVYALDSVEPNVLSSYSIVLISISTTGQGDLPANSRLFWKKILRKKLPPDYLSAANVAIFGLGDTSYPQYNWAALKLHKRLRQLGASELLPKGEGDEQHPEGVDAAFVPWMQNLRQRLLEIHPLPAGVSVIPDDVLLQPPWLLSVTATPTHKVNGSVADQSVDNAGDVVWGRPVGGQAFEVELRKNERLTPEKHFQDVRHLSLVTEENVAYLPGDILTVYPRNVPEDVDVLLVLLRWQDVADREIEFAANPLYTGNKRPEMPYFSQSAVTVANITLREMLTSHVDFNAIPRRSFFSLIAHFTNDETQKERLLEFANPEFIDELFDYTTRPRRSILEVLQEFDTLSIPWQWAAAFLPTLRGRQFSIASGGVLKQPNVTNPGSDVTAQGGTKIDLLVAIVKYQTVIRKVRRGVCTRYLEGLAPGTKMHVTLQRGALGITAAELEQPVVMIGPGTGLAPIRALIWQRWQWSLAHQSPERQTIPRAIGDMALFFGCRNEQSDYFFRDEWKRLQELGLPLTVFAAFSRDQAKKVYVQDLIREQHKLLFDLLQRRKGIVFVCGSSGRMPLAVRSALLDAFQTSGAMSTEDAEAALKSMEKTGRYKQETW